MIVNVPANVVREYKLDVMGSNASVFPKIWAVDAVGIGATNKELRMPCCARFLKESQSYIS